MKHVFQTNYSGPAKDWGGCRCPECLAALGIETETTPKLTMTEGHRQTITYWQSLCQSIHTLRKLEERKSTPRTTQHALIDGRLALCRERNELTRDLRDMGCLLHLAGSLQPVSDV